MGGIWYEFHRCSEKRLDVACDVRHVLVTKAPELWAGDTNC